MNNGTAIGYALMVLKDWGLTPEKLSKFESDMRRKMDMVSEDEAEEVYKKN
jgi:hypothetical protein